jgi:hypothetical protein
VQGIGASLSGLVAGIAVDQLGYRAAFMGAGVVATAAFLTSLLGMPETTTFAIQAGLLSTIVSWTAMPMAPMRTSTGALARALGLPRHQRRV